VDDAQLGFLFGTVPDEGAYDDEDGRIALLRADRPDASWPPPSIRVVIANQVLDGDPPETWATAARLLAGGLDRHAVMDQLVGAMLPSVEAALRGETPDPDSYPAALGRLPAPDIAVLTTAYLEVVQEQRAVPVDRLLELLATRLGLDVVDRAWIEGVEHTLMLAPGSPITMAQPDLVVNVSALADGIVLTHRLSVAEHVEEYLDLDADLAGFLRFPAPRTAQGPLVVEDMAWAGPSGWLASLPLDALLAVRVSGAGVVTTSVQEEEPVAPAGLVDMLRAVYDAEVAEPGLPVTGEMLVVGMLLRDRDVFSRPVPPLTELAEAAGLEQRGHEFAHDESVWATAEEADRQFRMIDQLATPADREAALDALDLLTLEADDPAALRRALDLLGSPDVLVVVVDELLDEHDEDDGERVADLVVLADRLVAAAGRSPRAAVAGWVAATAAERDGRVLDAESHLRAAAQAAEGWGVVEDRLAGYESDRGDAAAALGRWLSVETPDDHPDVVAVRPFAAAAGPEPGRNDPCWCGSGRKYKQCHRGQPPAAPLADRVGWLYRKAVGYVERRGGAAADLLELHADALAGEDGDPLDTWDDPLVVDTVLHEGGWFARFLTDRGPLLPADERELAASWTAVERGVYEIVDAGHVRDVRTGEQLETAGWGSGSAPARCRTAPAAGCWSPSSRWRGSWRRSCWRCWRSATASSCWNCWPTTPRRRPARCCVRRRRRERSPPRRPRYWHCRNGGSAAGATTPPRGWAA